MWKILFADDEASYHKLVLDDLIRPLFPEDCAEICAVGKAFADGKNADKELLANKYHMAFIDSYFQSEDDLLLNGKKYPPSILGKALIEKNIQNEYPLHYFFITAYRENLLEIDDAYTAFDNHHKVNSFPKAKIEKTDRQERFKNIVKSRLKSLAEKILNQISTQKRKELLETQLTLDTTVSINHYQWSVRSLCAGWWDSELDNFSKEPSKIIRDLLIPDITLAASETLNVYGLKSITHSKNQSYFPYKNDDELINEIQRQFHKFDQTLNELEIIERNDNKLLIEKIKSYKDKYEDFKKLIKTADLQDESNLSNFTSFRNENFRYGSEPSNQKDRKTIILNGKKPLGKLTNEYDCEKFEVNIPIHELFKNVFDRIFKKLPNDQEKVFDLCGYSEKADISHSTIFSSPENEVKIKSNYLIIPSKSRFRKSNILNRESPPHHFELMQSLYYEYFGRYHIITKSNGTLNVFNCSDKDYIYEINIENIVPKDHPLVARFIEKNNDYKSFHLFTFKTLDQ